MGLGARESLVKFKRELRIGHTTTVSQRVLPVHMRRQSRARDGVNFVSKHSLVGVLQGGPSVTTTTDSHRHSADALGSGKPGPDREQPHVWTALYVSRDTRVTLLGLPLDRGRVSINVGRPSTYVISGRLNSFHDARHRSSPDPYPVHTVWRLSSLPTGCVLMILLTIHHNLRAPEDLIVNPENV